MTRPSHSAASRRAFVAAVALLALGVPTVAYPVSLSHLLRLPLEQLLRLQATSLHGVAAPLGGGPRGR